MAALDVDFAMAAIRRHLARHPHGADTLEGVHGWWIDWPGLPASIAATERALERLEQHGLVASTLVARRRLWRAAGAARRDKNLPSGEPGRVKNHPPRRLPPRHDAH